VSTQWGAYPDGWSDSSGNGRYFASTVLSLTNGVLTYDIHTDGGTHMTAVPYPKLPGASDRNGLLYGRYAVRFRTDTLPGYKLAFLLWPDSEAWPRDGEIDFPEGNLDSPVSAYVHRQGATSGTQQEEFSTDAIPSAWHTAVIEWTEGSVRFLLDSVLIGTSTRAIPHTPMHWVLQTETALDGSIPRDDVAGKVQIDWVAVYRPAA
jgi:beta-glucanase (GH16 family)